VEQIVAAQPTAAATTLRGGKAIMEISFGFFD